MAKKVIVKNPVLIVQPERMHYKFMLAKNPNYFGNIPGSKIKPVIKLVQNTSYEQLTCVGYNPDTQIMTATFSIKKPSGYSGGLCTAGSFEYVRFYLDFHDSNGFIDQGCVAVNVHDIPAMHDCADKTVFPVCFAATLKKKTPKNSLCGTPVLPTLRAILSWNSEPPAESPGWLPPWGNIMDSDIQLKPATLLKPDLIFDKLDAFFELAAAAPDLSMKQVAEFSGVDIGQIKAQQANLTVIELFKKYQRLQVPELRLAFKTVSNMIKYPSSEITLMDKSVLGKLKINVDALIDQLAVMPPPDTSKANVDYEELDCVGLDYNMESLVATIKIKKKAGYSGDLCDAGSKEYVSFWIDWDDSCSWQYVDTVKLQVHDIQMSGSELSYCVALPIDTTFRKKLCSNPNIVRVRGVLSWNVAPSTTDPDQLEYYGNRVDSHIQIKPGEELNSGEVIPLFNIIGGIDVAHVDDVTGLTKSGSFFAFNGVTVPTGSPFGGIIVLNGPSFPGYRYRIRTINLTTGASKYITDSFTVVGHLTHYPWVQYTTQIPDPVDHWYSFLPFDQNTLNVLARFVPGTEDKIRVEMEVETVFGVFSKVIQMDNTAPQVHLEVDDGGDCTHYAKGDTITGHYFVYDKNILSWGFETTWGNNAYGLSNTPALPGTFFTFATQVNAYPCGRISLYAYDKTIVNSQAMRSPVYTSYNICLREPGS